MANKGCARCEHRYARCCTYPNVEAHLERIRAGSSTRVDTYVTADLESGSPTIMPAWCPLTPREYRGVLEVVSLDVNLQTVTVRIGHGWKLVQMVGGFSDEI